uniref:C2H2-type domain-containing protein n=1 Tax=Pelusios castaneus TaxID=367368 RepID=A0A8C8RSQ0_9SAUR
LLQAWGLQVMWACDPPWALGGGAPPLIAGGGSWVQLCTPRSGKSPPKSPVTKKQKRSHRLLGCPAVSLAFYRCDICKKDIKRLYNFRDKVHSDEAPFPCNVCTKRFKRTSCLIKHLRIHTEEKPFKCPQCSKRFKWEASVKEHQRIHTGERPFRCEHCIKSFTHFSTFLQHKRTHQTQKQFSSPVILFLKHPSAWGHLPV